MTIGDTEPADMYDPTQPPDPTVVARRLHEVRAWLAAEHGDDLAAWDALDPAARDVAVAIMRDVIGWLRREGTLWAPPT